jgi:hypothetical protein
MSAVIAEEHDGGTTGRVEPFVRVECHAVSERQPGPLTLPPGEQEHGGTGLALLSVPDFDVDLEFSGGFRRRASSM